MRRFYFRIHLTVFLLACGATCNIQAHAAEDIARIFVFELRMSKPQTPDPQTRIELTTATGADATFLSACKQREQGDSTIYQRDFVLDDEPSARRALIVSMDSRTQAVSQVFLLSIPRKPKPRDFSQWQHPNFLAKGDVGWAMIYNRKVDIVSTNIPPHCFELRYKVETKDLGPTWDSSMRRKDNVTK